MKNYNESSTWDNKTMVICGKTGGFVSGNQHILDQRYLYGTYVITLYSKQTGLEVGMMLAEREIDDHDIWCWTSALRGGELLVRGDYGKLFFLDDCDVVVKRVSMNVRNIDSDIEKLMREFV